MKIFILFLILSFFGGVVAWRMDRKVRNAFLVLACLGIVFAFFFLNKI